MAKKVYSLNEAGYRAWLEDGHLGTFEVFLKNQEFEKRKDELGQIMRKHGIVRGISKADLLKKLTEIKEEL